MEFVRTVTTSTAAATLVCAFGAVLAGCVGVRPIPADLRPWSEVSPDAECPYLNVFVDQTHEHPEKARLFPGWEDAEPHRVKFLTSAARSLPDAGWRIVREREDAAFILNAQGSRTQGSTDNIVVFVMLVPTAKTIHHAFIGSLNDAKFPLEDRGFGVVYTTTLYGSYSDVELQNITNRFLEFTQVQAFKTVAALCDTRAQLTDEGTSLEELRKELVEEIHRVRRERQREMQEKKLQMEVEPH